MVEHIATNTNRFANEYSKQIKVSPGEVDYVFLHIKQTGFIEKNLKQSLEM